MLKTVWKLTADASSVDRDDKAAWQNPTYAQVCNDLYATALIKQETYSDWLRCVDFGFTTAYIPEGSIILGIEVKVHRKNDKADLVNDSVVRLRNSGGQVGDNKASAVYWDTTEEEVIYGGAADDWNAGLSDSDIRAATFGVDISPYSSDPDFVSSTQIDCVLIRIHYLRALPTVITPAVDNIQEAQADGHGSITDNGGEGCDKRGVCWNMVGSPDVDDDKAEDTDSFGIGVEQQIIGHSEAILYSAYSRRAQRITVSNRLISNLGFYIKKVGSPSGDMIFCVRKVSDDSVLLGLTKVLKDAGDLEIALTWEEVEFDTAAIADEEVRFSCEFYGGDASNCVKACYAGVNVKDNEWLDSYYNSAWHDAGKIFDLLYKYTYGTGPFTKTMTGLSAGTKYYVRAYAHNSAGYGYGNEVDFTTLSVGLGASYQQINPLGLNIYRAGKNN